MTSNETQMLASTVEVRALSLKLAEEAVGRLFPVDLNPSPIRVVADARVPKGHAALIVDGKLAAVFTIETEGK